MGWTALLNDKNEEIGFVGDKPWDIIGAAMDDLVKCYQETVGRLPTAEELEQVLTFTLPDELRNFDITVISKP